uniref:Uncharacterized protein n=1 Tax=Globodera rostochiensis TaxID=31243 RepID=A0A914H9N4_GLORO
MSIFCVNYLASFQIDAASLASDLAVLQRQHLLLCIAFPQSSLFAPFLSDHSRRLRKTPIDPIPLCLPKFPADDSAGASSAQALAKWLHTPRGDGLPKVMKCGEFCSTGMAGLQMEFVNSVVSVNFIIIVVDERFGFVPFELKNTLTDERLVSRRFDEHKWLFVRCPIERDEAKWAELENEAIEWNWNRWNSVDICFNDSGIDDGLLDENEGPSEPKK